jgi:hypothetical protein
MIYISIYIYIEKWDKTALLHSYSQWSTYGFPSARRQSPGWCRRCVTQLIDVELFLHFSILVDWWYNCLRNATSGYCWYFWWTFGTCSSIFGHVRPRRARRFQSWLPSPIRCRGVTRYRWPPKTFVTGIEGNMSLNNLNMWLRYWDSTEIVPSTPVEFLEFQNTPDLLTSAGCLLQGRGLVCHLPQGEHQSKPMAV